MTEQARIVMDTPLGEVTISGSYRVVMEVQKRCNAHHRLLTACIEAYELLEDRTNTYPEPCEDVVMLSTMLTLKAAIEKARGVE